MGNSHSLASDWNNIMASWELEALHLSVVTTLHIANPVPMAGKESKEVLSNDFKETFI